MKSQRILQMLLAGAALAVVTCANADSAPNSDIGVFDGKTGALKPLPRPTSAAVMPAAGALVHGVIVVHISAVNKSKIATNANVGCGVSWYASTSDNSLNMSRYYATRALITAAKITCTVLVPYALTVGDPSLVTIELDPNIGLIEGNGAAVAGSGNPSLTNVSLPSITFPLPPNAATVAKDFSTAM
jgi:hypothetical protein